MRQMPNINIPCPHNKVPHKALSISRYLPGWREFWLRLGDATQMRQAWLAGAVWPIGFWHGISAGLSAAWGANLAIYVQTFRAVRVARAAVILGDAAAIGRGVRQAPHLAFKALGVTILIVGGYFLQRAEPVGLLQGKICRNG